MIPHGVGCAARPGGEARPAVVWPHWSRSIPAVPAVPGALNAGQGTYRTVSVRSGQS
jgi:hypothetical protein